MTRVFRSVKMLGVIALFTGTMVLVGCGAKAPEEEIAGAQATIDSVKALSVVQQYGQTEIRQVESQLARARQLVTEKRNEDALAAALQAQQQARAVVTAAGRNRDAAMRDAEQAVADAKAAIEEARQAIPKAPRWGKGAIRDIAALEAAVTEAASQVATAEQDLADAAYRDAAAAARSAAQAARAVTQTVVDAIELRESARTR